MAEVASAPVLELFDVRRSFGGLKAVDGVTLSIPTGAVVALIGPNGAGKSTLFALVMGELALSAGEIRLDGRDVRRLSAQARARAGIGRTFQTPRLFAGLSVRENMLASIYARARVRARGGGGPNADRGRAHGTAAERDAHLSPPGSPGAWGIAAAALGEVGLYEQRAARAGSLSQGQRKRLELAMVLAPRPRVLLLDEPTAGMGVAERAAIMRLVMDVVRRRGLTIFFCEHDMETVFAHAARVVVMDRGAIIADGTPARVRADPGVQRIYLGGHDAQVGSSPMGVQHEGATPEEAPAPEDEPP